MTQVFVISKQVNIESAAESRSFIQRCLMEMKSLLVENVMKKCEIRLK